MVARVPLVQLQRPLLAAAAILLVVALAQPVQAQAVPPYTQRVWFDWTVTTVDVLIADIHDPFIGVLIEKSIQAWKNGITLFNPTLGGALTFRVYWPDSGMAPPPNFVADIVVVPQGFMAIHPFGGGTSVVPTCYATAPMAAGFGPFIAVIMHEFGHCLGQEHVFWYGVEYSPYFDVMGSPNDFRCPSNLNVEVVTEAFKTPYTALTFSKSVNDYRQGDPATMCTTIRAPPYP